jgi:nitrogen-specific signal transduction histidine kinase
MSASSRSLIDFIDAPILVGDPEGRAVYVNACFERSFSVSRESVTGESLAGFFQGGAREAVLRAVAGVCGGEPSTRFRLREGDKGWMALASPLEAEGGRVGVIIVLMPEPPGEDRLQTFRRDVQESLDELSTCLAEISQETGGRRLPRGRVLVGDGLRAVERMRKWASVIEAELRSTRS